MTAAVDPRWYGLRNALCERRFNDAEALLRDSPVLLLMTNGLGETVLHFLAVENDREGVEWLRVRGADLDTKNAFGTPVLFEVAQLEYKELYAWFVERGADTTTVDGEGNSVVDYLLEYDLEEMANWVQRHDA